MLRVGHRRASEHWPLLSLRVFLCCPLQYHHTLLPNTEKRQLSKLTLCPATPPSPPCSIVTTEESALSLLSPMPGYAPPSPTQPSARSHRLNCRLMTAKCFCSQIGLVTCASATLRPANEIPLCLFKFISRLVPWRFSAVAPSMARSSPSSRIHNIVLAYFFS